jgi:uncharacterized membrane protein (DUF485 family)
MLQKLAKNIVGWYRIMSSNFNTFASIMASYILLSYVLFPSLFYYFVEKTLMSAGNGFVVGSVVSIALWYVYGKHMIK